MNWEYFKEVWQQHCGKITGAYFRDSKFGGREFVIVFSDKDEKYSSVLLGLLYIL